jgi:hypothetical protein
MSKMMAEAAEAVAKPEVQAMIKELGKYGLGVFIPHGHTDRGGFVPLPSNTVQLESNLKVSFVKKNDPVLKESTIVGWAWDKKKARIVAACACRGNHYPGGCRTIKSKAA